MVVKALFIPGRLSACAMRLSPGLLNGINNIIHPGNPVCIDVSENPGQCIAALPYFSEKAGFEPFRVKYRDFVCRKRGKTKITLTI